MTVFSIRDEYWCKRDVPNWVQLKSKPKILLFCQMCVDFNKINLMCIIRFMYKH